MGIHVYQYAKIMIFELSNLLLSYELFY